jgi:hypothetical protein
LFVGLVLIGARSALSRAHLSGSANVWSILIVSTLSVSVLLSNCEDSMGLLVS